MSEYCEWHLVDDNEYGIYEMSCGEIVSFEDDSTLQENGVKECPYCGLPIKEI